MALIFKFESTLTSFSLSFLFTMAIYPGSLYSFPSRVSVSSPFNLNVALLKSSIILKYNINNIVIASIIMIGRIVNIIFFLLSIVSPII